MNAVSKTAFSIMVGIILVSLVIQPAVYALNFATYTLEELADQLDHFLL
jgi:hypothetical protein